MRKLKLQNFISKVKLLFKKLLSTRNTSDKKSISHKPNDVDVAIVPDNSEQIRLSTNKKQSSETIAQNLDKKALDELEDIVTTTVSIRSVSEEAVQTEEIEVEIDKSPRESKDTNKLAADAITQNSGETVLDELDKVGQTNLEIIKEVDKENLEPSSILDRSNSNTENGNKSNKSFGLHSHNIKELNIGNRVASSIKTYLLDDIIFVGKSCEVSILDEKTEYPIIYLPCSHTPILGPIQVEESRAGVSENLLFLQLSSELEKLELDINIYKNTAIPVLGESFCYLPDICLFWPSAGIAVDIEIDEPYDGISREPIHYIESNDNIRNEYLASQGWFVIRFTEEQVVQNTKSCISYILHLLNMINMDAGQLKILLNDEVFQLPKQSRWRYDEALQFEKDKLREVYLGLNFESGSKLESKTILSNPLELSSDRHIYLWDNLVNHFNENKDQEYLLTSITGDDRQFVITEIDRDESFWGYLTIVGNNPTRVIQKIKWSSIQSVLPLDKPYLDSYIYDENKNQETILHNLIQRGLDEKRLMTIEYVDLKGVRSCRTLLFYPYRSGGTLVGAYRDLGMGKLLQASNLFAFCAKRQSTREFYLDNRLKKVFLRYDHSPSDLMFHIRKKSMSDILKNCDRYDLTDILSCFKYIYSDYGVKGDLKILLAILIILVSTMLNKSYSSYYHCVSFSLMHTTKKEIIETFEYHAEIFKDKIEGVRIISLEELTDLLDGNISERM